MWRESSQGKQLAVLAQTLLKYAVDRMGYQLPQGTRELTLLTQLSMNADSSTPQKCSSLYIYCTKVVQPPLSYLGHMITWHSSSYLDEVTGSCTCELLLCYFIHMISGCPTCATWPNQIYSRCCYLESTLLTGASPGRLGITAATNCADRAPNDSYVHFIGQKMVVQALQVTEQFLDRHENKFRNDFSTKCVHCVNMWKAISMWKISGRLPPCCT